jgi:type I restriction enzyme S subunit
MQQLFPAEGETLPKLRFPEFRDSGEWKEYSIAKLVKENILFAPKDGNHGNLHPKSSDYVEIGIPFVMANDLKNGAIDFSKCTHITKELADSLQKGFAKEGDVLLTHKGTVGQVALIKKIEFPYLMLTPQVTYYRIKDKSKFSSKFLAALFTSESFQSFLKAAAGGGTRAYIGITEQVKLKITVTTNILEQQKIADCLTSIDEAIAAQTQKIATLKTHKKGLMQQLFPNTK